MVLKWARMKWFSSKLRMAVLLERQGATRYADSLFLFRAEDFDAEELDGAEVYSEPVALASGETYTFDATFEPEKSKPTQTV